MEAHDVISRSEEFIRLFYLEKLMDTKSLTKGYMGFHYKNLIRFDPLLADELSFNPKETLQLFAIAATNLNEDLKKNFQLRVKDGNDFLNKPINRLRVENLNKLLSVEGVLKRKSPVKGLKVKTFFECPTCGNRISVIQLDEDEFKEPSRCGCGRKGKFIPRDSEMVNVFSMVIEELAESTSGIGSLAQIKILCKADLTNPVVERLLYQGGRCDVTGYLVERHIKTSKGKKTPKIDWYLEANYIKVHDDDFFNVEWNDADIIKFKELALRTDWMDAIRQSIFSSIHGYKKECEGVILQMFGGVGNQNKETADVRGNIHCLLVGDPGTCKSTILKLAQKFSPKARYVAGTGITGVGLTASAVKDELLGGFTIEAGAIVLANKGCLMIDELDKVKSDFKEALHEPLSNMTVSVSKANAQATLQADTSVLAAANPKFGSYEEYNTIYSQIDMPTSLINRFDLVFPILESKLTEQDDREIVKKILGRRNCAANSLVCETEFSKDFIKKYIAYAKTIDPLITDEVIEFYSTKHLALRMAKRNNQDSLPINARTVDGFGRLVQAVARSRLHESASLEDARMAYDMVIYCVKQIGVNPETGATVEEFFSGKSISNKDIMAGILKVMRDKAKDGVRLMEFEEISLNLADLGFKDEVKVEEAISNLKKSGDVYEPKRNRYCLGG